MKVLVGMTIVLVSAYVSACGESTGVDDLESQVVSALKERVEPACYHEPRGVYDLVFQRNDGILYYEGINLDQATTDMLLGMEAIVLNPEIRNSYVVTDTGKEFISDDDGICVGTFEFDGLISLTEPAVDSGVTATQVTFNVKFEPFAWYVKAGMPAGIPKTVSVKSPHGSTDEVQKRFTIFQKMRNGWAKIDDQWGMLD